MVRILVGLAIAATCILAALALFWARAVGPLRDPHEALRDFYDTDDRSEPQLMDPLILAGPAVVPLVLQAVPDKNMKLRRYAIAYLGNEQRQEAVPVLSKILLDESEIYYFRSDALEALDSIDPSIGSSYAPAYVDRHDLLGDVARHIVAGNHGHHRRSWWEALWPENNE
jgi:hypothetical protein